MSITKKHSFVIPTEKNQDLIDKAKVLNHVPWCEDYEKMISGMRFRFIGSPELEGRLIQTRKSCQEFNNSEIPEDATLVSMIGKSREKLASILGHLGHHSYVRSPFNATLGCNIWIGDNSTVNADFRVADMGLVTIKDRTMVGPHCRIATVTHSLNYLDRRRPDGTVRPVEIGEDCWLGLGVTVLPGVTIGKGCVVAAGAVVAKDVAPFNLVGGVPAKIIRHLGDPEDHSNGDRDPEIGQQSVPGRKGMDDNLMSEVGGKIPDEYDFNLPRWEQT